MKFYEFNQMKVKVFLIENENRRRDERLVSYPFQKNWRMQEIFEDLVRKFRYSKSSFASKKIIK